MIFLKKFRCCSLFVMLVMVAVPATRILACNVRMDIMELKYFPSGTSWDAELPTFHFSPLLHLDQVLQISVLRLQNRTTQQFPRRFQRHKLLIKCFEFRVCQLLNHMGVSKNNGTPKSSILIGFSIINHPFWGFSPYFWKHPYHVFPLKPSRLHTFFVLFRRLGESKRSARQPVVGKPVVEVSEGNLEAGEEDSRLVARPPTPPRVTVQWLQERLGEGIFQVHVFLYASVHLEINGRLSKRS